jgi:hypothetical protein
MKLIKLTSAVCAVAATVLLAQPCSADWDVYSHVCSLEDNMIPRKGIMCSDDEAEFEYRYKTKSNPYYSDFIKLPPGEADSWIKEEFPVTIELKENRGKIYIFYWDGGIKNDYERREGNVSYHVVAERAEDCHFAEGQSERRGLIGPLKFRYCMDDGSKTGTVDLEEGQTYFWTKPEFPVMVEIDSEYRPKSYWWLAWDGVREFA